MASRISMHAKIRIRERVKPKIRNLSLLRIVKKKGKTLYDYDGDFRYYLSLKSIGKKVKVYQNNIYVFSNNGKRLVTVFNVLDKFLPIDKYKLKKEK